MKWTDKGGAAALAALAVLEAVPFRRAAMERLDLPSFGWDASFHALDGLTVYDNLRRMHVLRALGHVLDQHWWPPLWSVALAPFYFLFGARLETASLPSFVAFVLTPAAAWLLCCRLLEGRGTAPSLIAFTLLSLFFLRSPYLLEMSSWAMLESLSGLLALAAWLFFAGRDDLRQRRAAYAFGTALFFLKYYYGVFVIVPFLLEALWSTARDTRLRVGAAAVNLVPAWFAIADLVVCGALAVARSAAESRGAVAALAFLPSHSNILWALLVHAVLVLAIRRRKTRDLWKELTPELRAFSLCTIVPIGIWFLDPANVRGWWRQSFVRLEGRPTTFLQQLSDILKAVVDDYTLGVPVALMVLAGFLLSVASKERTLVVLGLSSALAITGLSFRAYPVGSRFLSSILPGVFAGAAAGIALFVARGRRPIRIGAAACVVLGTGIFATMNEKAWSESCAARAPFRFVLTPSERALVVPLLETPPKNGRIEMTLTDDPKIAATVRLGLRLRHRELPPEAVDIDEVSAR